jgi:X-Pro dipeptidyl-peptidase
VSFRQAEWQSVMHRWMDRWLDDIPNGVMTEPMADIQRPDGTWETHSSWPDVNAEKVELHFGPATEEAADTLRLGAAPGDPRQSFVDQVETQAVKIGNAEQTRPGRLAYVTQPLDQTVRLSGTPELRVRMDTTSTSALLSALLVDYGEGETVSVQGVDPLQLIQEPCEPENLAANTGCATPPEVSSTITPQRVLAWGHIDAKNFASLRQGQDLLPGEEYVVRWNTLPSEHVIPAGHRIGVVITGNDNSSPSLYRPRRDTTALGSQVTLHLNGSRVLLPVVGGAAALR